MARCSACGQENPAGARFCNSCGATLDAPGPQPREVRKTVTVIFCDVTGSTALGERLDPESLRRVMARYFEAMRTVIERHGGTVEKFIGDAVMAIFGVPVLHEDDALRAVRAACEMRAALVPLNDELERDYGTTLSLRTGVNTGEVVTGTEERLATGDAVNVAARLEQAAQPGEILAILASVRSCSAITSSRRFVTAASSVCSTSTGMIWPRGRASTWPRLDAVRSIEATLTREPACSAARSSCSPPTVRPAASCCPSSVTR